MTMFSFHSIDFTNKEIIEKFLRCNYHYFTQIIIFESFNPGMKEKMDYDKGWRNNKKITNSFI
jgi:hypothetical protein